MTKRRIQATESRRELLRSIDAPLETLHRSPRHGNYKDPTFELFYLLLTLKTRISEVKPSMRDLRRICPRWDMLAEVDPTDLRPALERLGLWRKRCDLLVNVAKHLKEAHGKVTLAPLRNTPEDLMLDRLRAIPGVGEKVARCVALYCLGMDISPMDTNATRVLSRVGVLPRKLDPKSAHAWIDRLVDPGASYRLHVNLVAHGIHVCKPTTPRCRACPLSARCRYSQTGR